MGRIRRKLPAKILIGDNLSSHINIEVLRECQRHRIRFVLLPLNTTQLTQPLDVSYFRPLKQAWRSILTQIKLKNPKLNCVEKSVFPQLLAELIDKMQFNASKIIQNGFRATGIYPYNPDEVFKKMPNARYKRNVQGDIDDALLSFLKHQRSPNKGKSIQRGTKKMLNIEPGKSVSYEDVGLDVSTKSVSTIETIATTSADDNIENTCPNAMEDQGEKESIEIEAIKDGTFVVVQFPTKKTCKHFVGTIIEIEEFNDFTIKFLKKTNKGFVFPNIDDISTVNLCDIVKILPEPIIDRRSVITFTKDLSLYKL